MGCVCVSVVCENGSARSSWTGPPTARKRKEKGKKREKERRKDNDLFVLVCGQ